MPSRRLLQLLLEENSENDAAASASSFLADDATLESIEGVKDNAVLHVVFAVADNEYESVDITSITEDVAMAGSG